ncbi:DUF4169 family protein [Paramagnetospirillum marisnigri]|uniref:DUF4169 family protein n=1 Tax=Paramagnetospirillum marisnigri TaxID=1285242 RepID=UPI0009ED227C|nr:DUF4169 family protein [Paramagnetospirillum marisnigri]
MPEIINLNRYRKARAKAEAQERAADNRVAFGRTKVEKTEARKAREKLDQALDGKKLED